MQPNTIPHDPAQGFDTSKRFTVHRPGLPALRTIDPTKWEDKDYPQREWMLDEIVAKRTVCMVAGDPGLGKSTILLQWAISNVTGKPLFGRSVVKGPCVCSFAEDDEEELHRRVWAIAKHYDIPLSDLRGLTLLSRVGLDSALVDYPQDRFSGGGVNPGEPTQYHSQLMNLCLGTSARYLFIDSLYDHFVGNEINRLQSRKFISSIGEIATEMDGAVIVSSHPSLTGRQNKTGESGSTAWGAAVRSRLYLRAPEVDAGAEPNSFRRELALLKNNYGRSGDVMKLRWTDGVFVREDAPGGLEGAIAKRNCERVFLDLLSQYAAACRYVSESKQATNYAPKAFAMSPDSDGHTKSDFTKAMERLFAAGKIKNGTYGRAGDTRKHIVACAQEDAPWES